MAKLSATKSFNRNEDALPLIPYARDAKTGQKISLPHDVLQSGGDWYDEKRHKNLICPHCDAKVHFFPEVRSKRGSSAEGAKAHFKTNPRAVHAEDCDIGKEINRRNANAPEEKPKRDVRGYCLNINSFDSETVRDGNLRRDYNTVSTGRYQNEHHGNTSKIPEDEMKYLEPYSVKNVTDVIKFLEKTDKNLIAKSVVAFEQQEFRLPRFLLFYNKAENKVYEHLKFKRFTSTLTERGQTYQPVVIELVTKKQYTPSDLKKKPCIMSDAIHVNASSKTGPAHKIIPRFFVDTDNTQVTYGFLEPGKWLVMGIARLSKDLKTGNRFIDVSITSPEQIKPGSIAEIWHNHKQRHGITGKAPSPENY